MRKQNVTTASVDAPVKPGHVQGERCIDTGPDRERVQQARAALLDDETYYAVAETFRALADGTRAKIVYSLLQHELCTCDLASIIGVSESVVSQHLRVLRSLRLVKNRRSGKQVFYSLDDLHIRILLSVCLNHVHDDNRQHEGMEHVLAFFNERAEDARHAAQ